MSNGSRRPGGRRREPQRPAPSSAAPVLLTLFLTALVIVMLFGTRLGLPVDLLSLFHKARGLQVRAEDWRPYASALSGYVVELPGVPVFEVSGGDPSTGPLRYTVRLEERDRYLFSIGHLAVRDVLPGGGDAGAVLAAGRDLLVRERQGRLAHEEPFRLGRFPGRECLIEERQGLSRVRLIVTNDSLFAVGVSASKAFALSPDADRFLGSFALTGGKAVRYPAGWTEFAPDDGRFSVHLPGLPQSERQTFAVRGGEMVLHVFSLDHGVPSVRYAVQYADYPDQLLQETGPAEAVLKKAATVDAFNIGGTVVSQRPLALDRHPGMELQVESAERAMRIRLFLVDKRLFKLTAAWPKKRGFSAEDGLFLDSFIVTP